MLDWIYFEHHLNGVELTSADEEAGCFYEFVPGFVEETGYLPIECRTCHKALIFWRYSKTNVHNIEMMLESLPVPVYGKYNEAVAVFYFKGKEKMLFSPSHFKKTYEQVWR